MTLTKVLMNRGDMVFYPSEYCAVPNVDLLTWTFGGEVYDQERDIYIDALNPTRRLNAQLAKSFIRRLISGFRVHGLRTGDSVLVHSYSDIIYPIIYLAIVGSGASFIGANPSSTAQELANLLALSKTKYIFTAGPLLPNIIASTEILSVPIPSNNIFIFNTPHTPAIPKGFTSWETLMQHGERDWGSFDNESISTKMTASLFSTSGTTGLPKVAEVSHRACIARCIASTDRHPKDYPVSRLLCLPMFHGVAATASHIDPLRYGIPTYILPRFALGPFLDTIEKFEVTETSMVPAVVSMILQGENLIKMKRKMKSLRFVRCAGASLSVGVQKEFGTLLNGDARIASAWGLTELGTATSFLGEEADESGSVGRLLANVEAIIVDANGKEIREDGCQGEVLARSPGLMNRYLGNEDASEKAFIDGWLRTGDVAYCEKGKWYLVGRSKEMIKVRGWQVAPAELEACLLQHPQVIDAAVIGIKSPTEESELPRAYVVLKQVEEPEVTENDLKDFLGARLAKYKALDGGIKFMKSLPKTASGKTLKRVLTDFAARALVNGAT